MGEEEEQGRNKERINLTICPRETIRETGVGEAVVGKKKDMCNVTFRYLYFVVIDWCFYTRTVCSVFKV